MSSDSEIQFKESACLQSGCQSRTKELPTAARDKTLMHHKHAPNKTDFINCHSIIEHKNRKNHLDFVRQDYQLCHADQHKYKKLLLVGIPIDDKPSDIAYLMYEVNTNCMGCHLKKTPKKRHDVRSAFGNFEDTIELL